VFDAFKQFSIWLLVAEIVWWIVVALGIRAWFRLKKDIEEIPIEYL